MDITTIVKNKTDMHSHLLYGIDDGSKTIDQSIEIAKNLKEMGFSSVVLTPHYIDKSNFCANNSKKEEIFKKLKQELKNNNIDLNLYLGNEIYINSNIKDLIDKGQIYPINNAKYLLIEFPLYSEINDVLDILYNLKYEGYKLIIAHPERYKYFQKDYKKVNDLYKSGVLFQCNYGSIINQYGKSAKKLFKYLLKQDMVDFLGTDIHKDNSSLYKKFDKCLKKIEKLIGKDKFKLLTEINPLKVINDEEIE